MQKLLFFITLLASTTFSAYSQNKPTKIYFYNSIYHSLGNSGLRYMLKTNFNSDSPIEIDREQLVTIQLSADSLGLIINNQAQYIQFEPGTSYYYLISYSQATGNFIVAHVSSQEFWFTVHGGRLRGGSQQYFFRAKN